MKKILFFLILSIFSITINAKEIDQNSLKAKEFIDQIISSEEEYLVDYKSISYNELKKLINIKNIEVLQKEKEQKLLINNIFFTHDLVNNTLLKKGFFVIEGIKIEKEQLKETNPELYQFLLNKNIDSISINYGVQYHYNENDKKFKFNFFIILNDLINIKSSIELGNFSNTWNFLYKMHLNNYQLSEEERKSFNPINNFGFITFNSSNLEIINNGGLELYLQEQARTNNQSIDLYIEKVIQEIRDNKFIKEEEKNILIKFIKGENKKITIKIKDNSPMTFMEMFSLAMTNKMPEDFNDRFVYIIK